MSQPTTMADTTNPTTAAEKTTKRQPPTPLQFFFHFIDHFFMILVINGTTIVCINRLVFPGLPLETCMPDLIDLLGVMTFTSTIPLLLAMLTSIQDHKDVECSELLWRSMFLTIFVLTFFGYWGPIRNSLPEPRGFTDFVMTFLFFTNLFQLNIVYTSATKAARQDHPVPTSRRLWQFITSLPLPTLLRVNRAEERAPEADAFSYHGLQGSGKFTTRSSQMGREQHDDGPQPEILEKGSDEEVKCGSDSGLV